MSKEGVYNLQLKMFWITKVYFACRVGVYMTFCIHSLARSWTIQNSSVEKSEKKWISGWIEPNINKSKFILYAYEICYVCFKQSCAFE